VTTRALRWLVSLAPRARRDGGGAPTLVIVRHHRVYDDAERPLYRLGVAASVLRAQLRWLNAEGLRPVTVAEGLRHLESGHGARVAMTFDDGYRDNVTRALPLLREAGAKATFYLTAGLIEERRAPWWDELAHALEHARVPHLERTDSAPLPLASWAGRRRALEILAPTLRLPPAERDARLAALQQALGAAGPAPCALATWDEAHALADSGMEVGAHTLTHPHLSVLDEATQEREIAGSVELVTARLGVQPVGLAYPGGDHDARTIAIARAAGLEHAVTTRAGVNDARTPRHTLRRRGFSEGTCVGPFGFSRRLALAELDGVFDGLRAERRAS
jgi:peptidoglycan/xylan/chitin deacetylase (PgdA/CDA1 family)